ncbi:Cell morphogenesis protein PAG1 [Physocladia obscura]|uniref:Cell morphogenesis protein PAG1 n=1 Tax=Physocladia obscura TaxID=109957 RepID=A0AAD5XJF9_9FUNG|nr:Cell morphogenesis protein PAG1 [Physocladia obscura]
MKRMAGQQHKHSHSHPHPYHSVGTPLQFDRISNTNANTYDTRTETTSIDSLPASAITSTHQRTDPPPVSQSPPSSPSHAALQDQSETQRLTLRQLFGTFVREAERLLHAQVYAHGGDTTVDLSLPLRPGADIAFDGVLKGLGAAAAGAQKDLVEALMMWRSEKSRTSTHWRERVANLYLLPEMELIVYNRQMMVANFILLRAWIEIIENLDASSLLDTLAAKMEYVAFNQLRYENPLITSFPTCKAHIDLNAEFLGKLSNIRFAKVSDGFVKEISELSKTVPNKDPNLQILKQEICIRAMRFLKLKIYPMESLEETAEFLMIFAGFFTNAQHPKIKQAYCEVFSELLEPIVAVATAEVNLPTWKDGIELIFGKAIRMIPKKGHTQHSLPLVTTTLCLSRKEFFVQNLGSVIDICVQRLRDKTMKIQALVSLTRILWVCTHRNSDALSAVTLKRVETLLKHIFPVKSTVINPPDVNVDMLTRIVYIAMIKYMESMMELFSILMLGVDGTTVPLGAAGGGGPSLGTGGSTGSDKSPMNSRRSESSQQTAGGSFSDFTFSSGGINAGPIATGGLSLGESELLTNANASAGPKRQIIGMRAFLLLLADIEEALENSSSSGGQSVSPWSNGFGGGSGGTGFSNSSITSGATSARSIVVQGKIKLLAPPFPSLNLSDKGDILALASIQDRSTASRNNSLAGDHTTEASWVSKMEKSAETTTEIATKAEKLGLSIPNNTFQRMSSNVRIYLERVNFVFGGMFISLGKVCGNHFWSSSRDYTFGTVTVATNVNEGTTRRSSSSDMPSNYSSLNVTGTSVADTSATSIAGMSKWAQYELLRNCIDMIPRLCPGGLSATRVVEMLAVYTFHVDEHVRTGSIQALFRIAKIVQGTSDNSTLGNAYWSMKGHKFRPRRSLAEATARVVAETINSLLLEKVTDALYYIDFDDSMIEQTGIWVVLKLSEKWLQEVSGMKTGEIDSAEIEHSMYDAECRGILCLCSTTVGVRKIGVQLLDVAQAFGVILKDKFGVQFGGFFIYQVEFFKLTTFSTVTKPLPDDDWSVRPRTKIFNDLRLPLHNSRVKTIIETAGSRLISKYFFESVSIDSERTRQREQQRLQSIISSKSCLLDLAVSESPDDEYVWDRCFQDLAQYFLVYVNHVPLIRCVSVLTNRLQFLHSSILASDSSQQTGTTFVSAPISSGMEPHHITNLSKVFGLNNTPVEHNVELNSLQSPAGNPINCPVNDKILAQWRIFLKLACACVEIVSVDIASSVQNSSLKPESLFRMTAAYLFLERAPIRKSAVIGMSCSNWRSYKTIFEVLSANLQSVIAPAKKAAGSQSSVSQINARRTERFRVELTHILSGITDFIEYEAYSKGGKNENMFKLVFTYIMDLLRFLSEPEIRADWEYHMLRYHYCNLVEKFYSTVVAAVSNVYSEKGDFYGPMDELVISKYIPFEARVNLFVLFESWSGFGKNSAVYGERQSKSMIRALEAMVSRNSRDPNKLAENMNKQRAVLQMSALKAMSSILHGPMSDPSSRLEFSLPDLLFWINDLHNSQRDEFHEIACFATQGLLIYNGSSEDLMTAVLRECYVGSDSSISGSNVYFNSLVNIYTGGQKEPIIPSHICTGVHPTFPCATPRLISLCFFKAGDPDLEVRNKAMRLFRSVTHRVWPGEENIILDWNTSIGAPSTVYKRLQVLASANLASKKPSLTPFIISELCLRVEQVSSRDGIRDILGFMIPWIRNLQLASTSIIPLHSAKSVNKVENAFLSNDGNNSLKQTENFLTDLFYITVCFGDDFAVEVEAIWINLLRRTNIANVTNDLYLNKVWPEEIVVNHVETVVDFILALGVSRRNPVFIVHAKKIIVLLSRILGCEYLTQYLLARVTPLSFTPMDNIVLKIGDSQASVPYCVDITTILPETPNRPPLTFGGLLSTFLVELILDAKPDLINKRIAFIIHMIFIQLDHFIALICEQMKILLVKLVRALPQDLIDLKIAAKIIGIIESKGDRKLWTYEDISPEKQEIGSITEITELVSLVVNLFSSVNSSFLEEWTQTALFFAVNCPVRHAACRSLQILRALKSPFDLKVFGEMFLRLSTTVADKLVDIQSYSLEILISLLHETNLLQNLIASQASQVFWAGISVLTSPLEHEYYKGIEILTSFISKIDLNNDSIQKCLLDSKPAKWKGNSFSGLQPLLIKGLQSSKCEPICLGLINKLTSVISSDLIDSSPARVLSSILINFPRLAQGFEADMKAFGGNEINYRLEDSLDAAAKLAKLSEREKLPSMNRIMLSYSKKRFRTTEDFIQQFVSSIRDLFFPVHEAVAIKIVSLLLCNKLLFYRKWSLRLLKMFIPLLFGEHDGSGLFTAFSLIDVDAELISPCLECLKSECGDMAAAVLQELLYNTTAGTNERYLRKNYGRISQESYDKVVSVIDNPNAVKIVESKTGWKHFGEFQKASRITRYNIASVVSTSGISSISTQLPTIREMQAVKPNEIQNGSVASVISYRIPAKPQPRMLVSEDSKLKLKKATQVLDDIFKDADLDKSTSKKLSKSWLDSTFPQFDVQVIFRLQLLSKNVKTMKEFSLILASDISHALDTDECNINVNAMDNLSDLDLEVTTFVVDLKNAVSARESQIAAIQADKLKQLLIDDKILWTKSLTAKTDVNFEPQIRKDINRFSEPFDSRLPYDETNVPTFSQQLDLSFASLSVASPMEQTKSLEKAVETLRIFPASFDLFIQLFSDLNALIEDFHSSVADDQAKQGSIKLMEIIMKVRSKTKMYYPSLARDGEERVSSRFEQIDLTAGAQKLMNLDTSQLTTFLEKRDHHVQSINAQVSSYLELRRQFSASSSLKSAILLGIDLMSLHGIILALQGTCDSLMKVPEV